MSDPETKSDPAAELLAKVMKEQKERKATLNDGSDGKVVPIKLDLTQGARVRGVVSYPGKPRSDGAVKDAKVDARSKAKSAKEPLDEALINEILGDQQGKGNGSAGPNFTFKEEPKEEPKDDADEEAVRSEAPSAVKALGLAEAKRRFMIRRLKL